MSIPVKLLNSELAMQTSLLKVARNDSEKKNIENNIADLRKAIERIQQKDDIQPHQHAFLLWLNDKFSYKGKPICLYDGTIKTAQDIIDEFEQDFDSDKSKLLVTSSATGFTRQEWNKLAVGDKLKTPAGKLRTVTKVNDNKNGKRGVRSIILDSGAKYSFTNMYKYTLVRQTV